VAYRTVLVLAAFDFLFFSPLSIRLSPSFLGPVACAWIFVLLVTAALLLAWLLRIGFAVRYESVDWPDEIYQTESPRIISPSATGSRLGNFEMPPEIGCSPRFLASSCARQPGWDQLERLSARINLVLSLLSLLPVYFGIRWPTAWANGPQPL